MWPGVPFTLRVTSENATSNASSSPGLIVAKTIILAGIGSLPFDVDHEVVDSHSPGFAKLPQRRGQLILLRAALETAERVPALPITRDDEAARVVGVT